MIRTLYKSDRDEDIEQMEDYCFQYADKYDYLEDEWNLFDLQAILRQKIQAFKKIEVVFTSYFDLEQTVCSPSVESPESTRNIFCF